MNMNLPYKLFVLAIVLSLGTIACNIIDNWALSEIPNDHEFQHLLSEYELFKGNLNEINPSDDVVKFELTTELFTDYAYKQRLFKLPSGTKITVNNDGSFIFPDGSIIAKTFYYPTVEDDSGLELHIIETRLLLKEDNNWNVAVYEWNREQTEAFFINEGTKRNVKWVDDDDNIRTTRYRIPSLAECTTCHQATEKVVPIGPKLSNMNHKITVNQKNINQLEYLESAGVITSFNRDGIQFLPDWSNTVNPLEKRARAYLDVNCAHCHSPTGIANQTSLYLSFDNSLNQSGISQKSSQIQRRMQSRWRGEKMPMIGTTIIHKEGVELIKEYLEAL
jgi:uncharacterized repeat protein (TIGR03806 family)